MKFEIKTVTNGLVLTVIDDEEKKEEVVYQQKHDDEVECFADFLCFIVDYYGPVTSRYSEKRINIVVSKTWR